MSLYGCGDTLSEEALLRSGETVRYRSGCLVGRGCCLLRYGKMGLDGLKGIGSRDKKKQSEVILFISQIKKNYKEKHLIN